MERRPNRRTFGAVVACTDRSLSMSMYETVPLNNYAGSSGTTVVFDGRARTTMIRTTSGEEDFNLETSKALIIRPLPSMSAATVWLASTVARGLF